MITYLIEVSVCWLLFYGIYMLLLRKETFFNINRWYLLSTLGLGLMIPLFTVDFTSLFYQEPASSIVYLAEGFSELEYVIADSVEKAQKVEYSWLTFLKAIYLIGVFVTFIRCLYGFRQIYSLYKSGTVTQKGKYQLVLTETPHLPFSFFNYLFWHKDTALEDTDSGKIITHELAHINQWHSLDVLFLETLGILLWFSPPIYWYKKSLRAVHEFLADAYVLRDTKKKQYGHLLIRQVQSGMQISLANNFIHSQLKQRIKMMTRNQSRRKELMRYLPALPLLLLMVLVFSNKNVQQNFKETTAKASLVFEASLTDTPPIFPGGKKEMLRFIYRNIKYPAQARAKGIYGNATIQFVVEKDGSISNLQALGDVGGGIQAEILRIGRLIQNFPTKWTPAKKKGVAISTVYELPIQYRLEGEKADGTSFTMKDNKGTKKGNTIVVVGLYKENNTLTQQPDPIFKEVDKMPRYPGCEGKEMSAEALTECAQKEMLTFIYTNIKYPEQARKQGIEGTVVVKFVVDKNGKITTKELVRSIGGRTGEEVLRVVGEMPNWIPGQKDGKAVSVFYHLPVKFKLAPDAKKEIKDLEKDLPEIRLNSGGGIKPLIVVNGEEYKGDLKDVSSDNIATINVLKDEAAIKKYGDKGKNGVIEIQLKSTNASNVKEKSPTLIHTSNGEKIFKVVDNMPLFPGCDGTAGYSEDLRNCANQKMLEFIYQNVKYPEAARKEGIEGVVVIRFLVEKDGAINNAEIVRNVGGGTGEEALRVVNLMKKMDAKWIPGEEAGEKVNVIFNLPVKFKLADDVKEELAGKKEEKENIIYHPTAPQIPIGYKEEAVTFDALTLNVFPNPVQDQLSVTLQGEAKNALITVFDVTGKEFFREKIGAFDGTYHKTIDLQNTTKGTLIVNVRHKGKDYQKKVIVQ